MLTTLRRLCSTRSAVCLSTRSSTTLLLGQRRSSPLFKDKIDNRVYAAKCSNVARQIFSNTTRVITSILNSSEQFRKYSSNLPENKQSDLEQTDEAENKEEEIPLLEINEEYLDTQKQIIGLVLRRDLQARDVKVYDFRDLNLTSSA